MRGFWQKVVSGEFWQKIGRFQGNPKSWGAEASFRGIAEGQKGFPGDSWGAEGGFWGIPHRKKRVFWGNLRGRREFLEESWGQKGVFREFTTNRRWFPGDSPPAEDGFRGLPDNRREISGGFPNRQMVSRRFPSSGRWCPGYSPRTEVGFQGILRAEGSKYPGESWGAEGCSRSGGILRAESGFEESSVAWVLLLPHPTPVSHY